MKFGIALGRLNPALHLAATLEAERLGFESVWLPEHLIFPLDLVGSPHPGSDHPPVPPTTPVFDCFAYLSFLAGSTRRIRLGSHVYLLGLRHPFAAARAIQTLDIVSQGRAEIGIGAGWLESEWRAAGLDFHTRGRRLDEAIGVCKHLFSDPVIAHRGEFFRFEPVAFEPKTVQRPWPPLLIGGESKAALRRAADTGDGWIGLDHTLESVREPLARLRALRVERESADTAFEICVGARPEEPSEIERWEEAGVTRLIVSPWRRSAEALDGLRRFAERFVGTPSTPDR